MGEGRLLSMSEFCCSLFLVQGLLPSFARLSEPAVLQTGMYGILTQLRIRSAEKWYLSQFESTQLTSNLPQHICPKPHCL